MRTPELLRSDSYLHEDKFGKLAQGTYKGQADFAVGPHTCRECSFFTLRRDEAFTYSCGRLSAHRCARYTQLMRGAIGPLIPPTALSCQYFEASPNPPPEKRGL